MRNPLNSYIESVQPSGIRKFFDIVSEKNDPDILSLGVGEPDFDTPWHIRGEAIGSLTEGKTFYTANAGLLKLREEISNFMTKHYGLYYDPQNEIIVTVGGSEGIDIALRTMLDPGDEIIIPEPSFVSYKPCAIFAGAKPVIVDLKEENEFKLSPRDLLNAITERTKMVLISYPNNPTGAIMNREDLEEIAKIIIDQDIYVLSDEIYSELNYTGDPSISIASLEGMRERTVVINGFSKAYAMTGWRLGWACGPRIIIKQMLKVHQFSIMCSPTISQYAAIDALKNGDEDVEYMRNEYDLRRRFLLSRFDRMGIPCFKAMGAFYLFPCIKKYGLSSDDFAKKLLEDQKLAVVPGSAFGRAGEGYLRISYAYSMNSLDESLKRLENFIRK